MEFDFSNATNEEIEDFYRILSSKIRKMREERNITQLDLALEIGIKSVAFYSNCENNRYGKHFNLEHLYKISKAFKIPLSLFFEER
jgi:transcriptional regulator with XRE-family HTH domain